MNKFYLPNRRNQRVYFQIAWELQDRLHCISMLVQYIAHTPFIVWPGVTDSTPASWDLILGMVNTLWLGLMMILCEVSQSFRPSPDLTSCRPCHQSSWLPQVVNFGNSPYIPHPHSPVNFLVFKRKYQPSARKKPVFKLKTELYNPNPPVCWHKSILCNLTTINSKESCQRPVNQKRKWNKN